MKEIYKLLCLFLLIGIGVSCGDDETMSVDPNSLRIEEFSDTIRLSEEQKDETGVVFKWTSGSEKPDAVISYIFKMDLADNYFSTENLPREELPTGTLAKSYTNREMNDLLVNFFDVEPGNSVELSVRVIASYDAPKFIMPEVSTINVVVKTFKPAPEPLYLLGDATEAGWDINKSILLNEKIFGRFYQWTGEMKAGQFKFLTQANSLLPSLNKGADEASLVLRKTEGESDDLFTVSKAGFYGIYLNREEMTIQHAPIPYQKVWMLGTAVSGGYIMGNAVPMVWSQDSLNVFTYQGRLSVGEMKLPLAIDKGSTCDYLMPNKANASLTDETVVMIPRGFPDFRWKVEVPGIYKVVLNTHTMKIRFELLKED